jgi:hypothetical protein
VKCLNRHSCRKQIKQDKNLVNVYFPGRKVDGIYTIPFLKDNVLVFDVGRGTSTAPISNPKVPGWCCHRIVDGALDVCVLLFYKFFLCHVHWVNHFFILRVPLSTTWRHSANFQPQPPTDNIITIIFFSMYSRANHLRVPLSIATWRHSANFQP